MNKDRKKAVGMRDVVKYFRSISMSQKRLFFFAIGGMVIASVATLVLPIYFAKMIDIIINFIGNDKSATTTILLGVVFMIFLLELGNQVGRKILGFSAVPLEVNNIKKIMLQCFEYLHGHSYRFFANNFSGSLVKKANKLAGSYENVTDIFMFNLIGLVIFVPLIIIIVMIKNRQLGLVFIVFVILFGIFQYIFYKRNVKHEIEANKYDSKITGELSDTITNNFNILTFASLPRELKKFTQTLTSRGKAQKTTWYRGQVIYAITGGLLLIFEVGSLFVAVKLWGLSLISAGTIVLIQTYVLRLFEEMNSLGNVFKRLNRAIGESAEMLEILKTPHEIQDKTTNTLRIHEGRIDFKQIHFHYVQDNPIFDNLDLEIKPGEKVAIVGESGGGKTSVVKLLFRFFDIQKGKILIDNQDISQVTQQSLRESMSIVPQDPILFHRTLKENISYGNPDASDEEIIAAAKMARCHEFISNFKDGYETLVGERGIKLSGGERQRVAIARAILENKRILVMDEATSSLDSNSEKLIQEAMDEVLKNKTAIVIAHRLSTIMKMDRIIVMDKGQIIENGTHGELLRNEHGIYKKLRDIQSGGFIE